MIANREGQHVLNLYTIAINFVIENDDVEKNWLSSQQKVMMKPLISQIEC